MLHFSRRGGHEIAEPRVNNAIRAREVRVVAPDGSQIGVKKIEEALWLADQLGLDLVEVAPEARPPVCRMMDYGKYKYEQSVKQREARKKQTRTVIKEVRLRPRIGDHDFDIVRRRAEEFLCEGDKVKVTVRFRGRENERPELGHRLVERLMEQLEEFAIVEQHARKDGRTMTMVMAPTRKALDLASAAKEARHPEHPHRGSDREAARATASDDKADVEAVVAEETVTAPVDAVAADETATVPIEAAAAAEADAAPEEVLAAQKTETAPEEAVEEVVEDVEDDQAGDGD